ncbi:hypothetical protein HUE56_26475 (plasmid) [Azospirillum oryzae]|uniref:Uncharacterized protein n=1 Tax=Azospirillum oryzae TaxID=286727 RepID=A0A6N1AY15_9PROT|nr:HEPN domain-containing protein [Azospirillum oryzae]QKS54034.1 hypothetical protein HUE56_26475 [Azospirillum oryzae]
MEEQAFPNLTVNSTKKLEKSERYLISKHNQLKQFGSVEDLATDESILSEKDREGILHNLLTVRSILAKALWKSGIFVGVSVLDEFVLSAAQNGHADICGRVIQDLRSAGVERPGFVLYPLTEFGMEIPPLMTASSELESMAVFLDANFAVTAQANGFDEALANLRKMATALGITAEIHRSDIEHYARGSNMKWLTRNPLMLVRLSSHTGDYYENQFIYTLKIRIAAAQVVMLHALSIDAGILVEKFQSSANVNNWETLDIRHYLVGEATHPEKPINLRRVPMNVAALELARLSDLAVTVSTRTLARSEVQKWKEKLTPILRSVEVGYLRYVNLSSEEKIHIRVYRRLVTSIDWYRQSFGSRLKEAECIVALAVAFETLLTDYYAPGSAARIQRRVGICLSSHPNVEVYKSSVLTIYHARSEIVHTGDGGHETEIHRAQAAFAMCFCEVASRLDQLDRKMLDPIRELLGDSLTQEEKEAKDAAKEKKEK